MLSDNIKTIRKNKGYSQEELASKLHVTRQTISKWENGQSEPGANILKELADLFEISVSELIDGDAERVLENEVLVEQLSRVNEHLVITQKRSKRATIIVCCLCAMIILVIGLKIFHDKEEKGYRVRDMEHIGKLTYYLPDSNYYHADKDVGITILPDGTYQISAKYYKCYEDMSEITIWDYGEYDKEVIDDFKKEYSDQITDLNNENGENGNIIPSDAVEYYIAATDGGGLDADGDAYSTGTFYKAFVVVNGELYKITVNGGDDPLSSGQLIVSTLAVDESLDEEITDKL